MKSTNRIDTPIFKLLPKVHFDFLKFFEPLKMLIFFLPNKFFFFQTDFLSVRNTFRPLKCNLKHALSELGKWRSLVG